MGSAERYIFLYGYDSDLGRVGVLMCPECGASVATHPSIDTTARHNLWHDRLRGDEGDPQEQPAGERP